MYIYNIVECGYVNIDIGGSESRNKKGVPGHDFLILPNFALNKSIFPT